MLNGLREMGTTLKAVYMQLSPTAKRGLLESIIGNYGYNFFLEEQNAIYSPQKASSADKFFNHALHEQTSGTSFFAPLALMGTMNMVLGTLEHENKRLNHHKREKFFEICRWVSPFAVAMLFEGWEILGIITHDPRPDNKGMDMLMSILAAAVVTGGNIKGEMDKKITEVNNSNIREDEQGG
jgi:hypothetical protein